LAASTIEHVGFIAIGLGLALMARGADLASLAALALGAAMLHALNHSVFKSLLFLVAGNVQHGAGSRALARLGGLVQRMPVTTAGALAGCAASAGLPLTSGFASEWLLFQTAFASPRVGGLALQSLIAVVVALMALAAALAAAASVRMIGVAFLGRPRTPRGSAAEEAGWPARRAVVGLAVVSGILGLAPGLALSLTQAALHALTGSGITGRAGWLGVAPVAGTPGYAPALLLLLLGLVGAGLFFVLRRWTVGGSRTSAAWQCGFAPPPPWLPFGDPATQYSGASFSQPLLRTLGARIMGYKEEADIPEPGDTRPATLALTSEDPAWPAIFFPVLKVRAWLSGQADRLQYLTIRRALVVMFAALVAFLVAITWLEAL
ncbi:MAG: hydrogenase 4 subunit B, partial [Acetobacteraceae bacterium]|nr:hydrogenase 4 subunit B [Acetobacteraceae bacterium]